MCYGPDTLPDISGSHTVDSSDQTSTSTTTLDGLLPSTAYYVRGYASSDDSTYYGETLSFVTDRDPDSLTVGDRYGGGRIGALFRDGETGYVRGEVHGIIVDTVDLGNFHWGCSTFVIGTTISFGDGQTNTDSIVAKCDFPSGAAHQCHSLERQGFTDWFLPSLYELDRLYVNREAIGMSGTYYWSSSEIISNHLWAWYKNFQTGANSQELRERYSLSVRAARYF